MPRVLHILVVLVAVAIGCETVNAQSISQGARVDPAAASFSRAHDALERTVDELLKESMQLVGDRAPKSDRAVELRQGTSDALQIDPARNASRATNLAPALRRLEELRSVVNPILQSEGVPLDMAFLVVVESGGRADALSPKGARGLWQLMPETARRYGLVVGDGRDERLDVEKSTRAAAQYLRDLHAQFRSWPIALAAYNAGEQAVQRAVDSAQSEEFAVLASRELLPLETRMYVPAVVYLIANSGNPYSVVGETTQRSRDARIVYAVQTKEEKEVRKQNEFVFFK